MSRQFTQDWLTEVALGNISGAAGVNAFGHNAAVGTSAEDLWIQGGTLTRMTSAETMNIVSTDTDDDGSPVGDGARTVFIAGLDSAFDPISETITMNGTSNVLTSNSYIRVRKLVVLTAGLPTTTNTNLGIITATASSASTVQATIAIGDGISQNVQYTVPNNKRSLLYKVELNAFKNTGGNSGIKFDAVITPPSAASFIIVEKAMETDQPELEVFFTPPVPFVEKTDIKMTAVSTLSGSELYARFMMIEIDD